MGTAIKRPVEDRVKPSFLIFDIRALWRYGNSGREKVKRTAENIMTLTVNNVK